MGVTAEDPQLEKKFQLQVRTAVTLSTERVRGSWLPVFTTNTSERCRHKMCHAIAVRIDRENLKSK